jgi:hypothetical protein
MKVDAACGTAAILFFSSLFVACSDVDIGTLYTSSGGYKVNALVNGNSLENCSIIRSNDKIQPYFADSVINDPDLTGLLVYLQNSRGEIPGEKIRYMLYAYVDEVDLPVTKVEIEESSENEEEATKSEETSGVAGQTTSNERLDSREKVVIVKSFDQDLPYFPIPQNLETGSYSLVFEALGRKTTLSHTEVDIYYLGDIEFILKDISLYSPGVSGSQLILPEATVLLEASLDYDQCLDPYLIWYRGKTVVSEGKMSEGAGSFLWKAPDQAGIYSMRLEAFPLHLKQNQTGILREISLPVSPKAVNAGYFFVDGSKHTPKSSLATGTSYPEQARHDDGKASTPPLAPELLQWFQFNGNLLDSTSTLTDERQLVSTNEKKPRWEALNQNYGLSIGPDDSYSISPVNFFIAKQDKGGGIFLFHLRPIVEGDIFNVFFPSQLSSTEGAWINVTSESNSIVLRLCANGQIIETPIYLTSREAQAFFPVVVEFYIRPYRIEAKLSLGENQFQQHEAVGIGLSGPLTGEGKIMLGTTPQNMKPPNGTKLQQITSIGTGEIPETIATGEQASALTTVWNEFAVLLSEIPLLPEELSETADQDALDSRPVTEGAGTVLSGVAAPSSEEASSSSEVSSSRESGADFEGELTDG